jgi:hypothetical protein
VVEAVDNQGDRPAGIEDIEHRLGDNVAVTPMVRLAEDRHAHRPVSGSTMRRTPAGEPTAKFVSLSRYAALPVFT